LGSSQNLRAVKDVPDRVPESEEGQGPESERRVAAHAVLQSLLDMAYGSRGAATAALERAMAVASIAALPDAPADVLVFVLGPLYTVLGAEIGPGLAKALVEDFTSRIEPTPGGELPRLGSSKPPASVPRAVARVSLRSRSSPPPAPERRVLLVDADRVGRAALARALMRERWGVRVVESLEDLADALGEAAHDALIVDVGHESSADMVHVFASAMPGAVLFLRGPEGDKTRSLRAAAGARRVEVCARHAPAEELIGALDRAFER
jgi:hypothetical protein